MRARAVRGVVCTCTCVVCVCVCALRAARAPHATYASALAHVLSLPRPALRVLCARLQDSINEDASEWERYIKIYPDAFASW